MPKAPSDETISARTDRLARQKIRDQHTVSKDPPGPIQAAPHATAGARKDVCDAIDARSRGYSCLFGAVMSTRTGNACFLDPPAFELVSRSSYHRQSRAYSHVIEKSHPLRQDRLGGRGRR